MGARVFGPLLLSASATAAAAQEAHFGLAWGPVTDVPRASMIDREANVTALTYLHDKPHAWAPIPTGDPGGLQDEGLQQVIWLGRPLPDAEFSARYDAILREGILRHGPPRSEAHWETVAWPKARTLLAAGKPGPGRPEAGDAVARRPATRPVPAPMLRRPAIRRTSMPGA